ncbi:hypothetical protein HMPREF0400_01772 [Fusobacterium periodonticum 1_1_41FAA]|uniref:Uncharacterized protein n=2 Tax=Fusobacterium periodonticum TaxID=860 RepID=D6LJ53_9FUSO|nr:hypothetical protein HMPREF0400_01772 [Fusobacterium periodonticum 1_1_41FAA]
MKISYNKNTLNSRGRNMRKSTKLNFIYILIAIPIYFFSTIFINHFQQYEYIFTDVNNIKKYQVTSNNDASYAYIKLDNNLYTEGEFSAFEIRKVYEDEDYFIAYYFKEKNYIVIDKKLASMKIYNEKEFKEKYRDINDEKFVDIYNFLKRKGTKIGIHREVLL